MNDWQSTYLGRGTLPRDLSGFEIEAFSRIPSQNAVSSMMSGARLASSLPLALQIGFLRMTGRLLEALCMVPPALWRHLGVQFDVEAPDLASLRTMYHRRRTLFEHQDLACAVVGFHSVTEAQRRALVRAINAELSRTSDRQRLLQFARRWLNDHKQIIPRERELRAYIAKAIRQHEATLVREIVEAIDPALLVQWKATIIQAGENGATVQSWLWAPPAKRSTRQIDQLLERIELLTSLKVDQHLGKVPEAIVGRYARRLAIRAPAVAARITEPTRTIEVACFLRYCLMTSTDHLLWMVRRRVADLWRKAADEADAQRVDYARLYQQLLGEVSALAGDGTLSAAELQQKLNTVLTAHREHRGPNRAQIIRDQLMEEVRPVRALLKALTQQPWKGAADHPLLTSLQKLNALYDQGTYTLIRGVFTVTFGGKNEGTPTNVPGHIDRRLGYCQVEFRAAQDRRFRRCLRSGGTAARGIRDQAQNAGRGACAESLNKATARHIGNAPSRKLMVHDWLQSCRTRSTNRA
jgi:hypothetical protein